MRTLTPCSVQARGCGRRLGCQVLPAEGVLAHARVGRVWVRGHPSSTHPGPRTAALALPPCPGDHHYPLLLRSHFSDKSGGGPPRCVCCDGLTVRVVSRSSVLFLSEGVHCTDPSLLGHAAADGHPGCSRISVIVDAATVNTGCRPPFSTPIHFFSQTWNFWISADRRQPNPQK